MCVVLILFFRLLNFQNHSFSLTELFLVKSEVHPKKILWGGDEEGVLDFLRYQTYFFGHLGAHAKFLNHSFTPSD